MRSGECAEVDLRKRLLSDEVDDGERVVGAETVIRNVGARAVGRGDDFMRIVADGNDSKDLQCCGVDDGESVILLGKREQAGLSGGLRAKKARAAEEKNGKRENQAADAQK